MITFHVVRLLCPKILDAARFVVPTAVLLQIQVFGSVTPYF